MTEVVGLAGKSRIGSHANSLWYTNSKLTYHCNKVTVIVTNIVTTIVTVIATTIISTMVTLIVTINIMKSVINEHSDTR